MVCRLCRQAIIWINIDLLLIQPQWTYFNELSIEAQIFPYKKMPLKVSSAKSGPFGLGLNVLKHTNALNRQQIISSSNDD